MAKAPNSGVLHGGLSDVHPKYNWGYIIDLNLDELLIFGMIIKSRDMFEQIAFSKNVNLMEYGAPFNMSTWNNWSFAGIQEPIPRWEMCAELVTRFMGLATFNLMERSQNVSQTAENIVTTAFNAIVEVVKTKLSQMDMTDLLSNYLKNKVGR